MSNEKISLLEQDEGSACLKPTKADHRIPETTTSSTLKATALAFPPALKLVASLLDTLNGPPWYPPAEYTNSFKPKNTGSSLKRETNYDDRTATIKRPSSMTSDLVYYPIYTLSSTHSAVHESNTCQLLVWVYSSLSFFEFCRAHRFS
jgi:hypothetical protein